MQTYFVDFLILFYKSSNEHNKYMYVIICDFFVVIGRLGGTNEPVFVTFYFGRNQIELFQELKLLNKKIARN